MRSAAAAPVDETAEQLREVASSGTHSGGDKVIKELMKRKLVTARKQLHFSVSKGKLFATEVKTLETDLSVDMLTSGKWKDTEFKQYNFAAMGQPTDGGALHPLLKVREEFRQIFFDLGFTEMPTNHFVESAFWNFDAMFVPQQHPAREMQDTFYVKGECNPLQSLRSAPSYGTVVSQADTRPRQGVHPRRGVLRACEEGARGRRVRFDRLPRTVLSRRV